MFGAVLIKQLPWTSAAFFQAYLCISTSFVICQRPAFNVLGRGRGPPNRRGRVQTTPPPPPSGPRGGLGNPPLNQIFLFPTVSCRQMYVYSICFCQFGGKKCNFGHFLKSFKKIRRFAPFFPPFFLPRGGGPEPHPSGGGPRPPSPGDGPGPFRPLPPLIYYPVEGSRYLNITLFSSFKHKIWQCMIFTT